MSKDRAPILSFKRSFVVLINGLFYCMMRSTKEIIQNEYITNASTAHSVSHFSQTTAGNKKLEFCVVFWLHVKPKHIAN